MKNELFGSNGLKPVEFLPRLGRIKDAGIIRPVNIKKMKSRMKGIKELRDKLNTIAFEQINREFSYDYEKK